MKKVLLLFAIILFVVCANAQIKKGAVLIGGQISASSNKSESQNNPPNLFLNSSVNNASVIGFNIGTAFKQNKIAGINFTTSSTTSTNTNSINDVSTNTNNTNGIGLFYRSYKKLAKNFYFFGQADAAFLFGKGNTSNSSVTNSTFKSKGISTSFTIGAGYEIIKHVQIEITIPNIIGFQSSKSTQTITGFNSNTITNTATNIYSSFSNTGGLGALGVGFRVIL